MKLGKEHILPEGIGGNFTILEASCFACERKINKAERLFQTMMFDQIRHHLNLSSRKRPAHKRPSSMPVAFTHSGKKVTRQIPLKELPVTILGLAWPPPGIWTGREKGGGTNQARGYPINNQMLDALMAKYGAEGVAYPKLEYNTGDYFVSVAKIAHSFAVSQYGLEGFYPFLLDYILQRPPDFPVDYFIGGLEVDNPPLEYKPDSLHHLQIVEHPFAGVVYLVVFVGLFVTYGFPMAQVVVGVRKDGPQTPLPEVK